MGTYCCGCVQGRRCGAGTIKCPISNLQISAAYLGTGKQTAKREQRGWEGYTELEKSGSSVTGGPAGHAPAARRPCSGGFKALRNVLISSSTRHGRRVCGGAAMRPAPTPQAEKGVNGWVRAREQARPRQRRPLPPTRRRRVLRGRADRRRAATSLRIAVDRGREAAGEAGAAGRAGRTAAVCR